MKWQKVKLGEVCKIVQGGRLKLSGKDFVEDGFPAYGAGGLNGYLSQYEFDCEAVILSSIGARCGKCFFATDKWISLANTQLIFPSAEVNALFLWYQLNDENRWPRAGTGQPFIRPSDVKSSLISLPPLDEQKRIASILDAADALRRVRRQSLARLDELAQSLFLELFGDPATNPKRWEMRKLGEIGELDRGQSKHRPRDAPELFGGDYPFIQTGDVARSGGYIRKFSQTYSEVGLKQSKLWPTGTLCITIAANIAKTAMLTFDACFPDSVVGFKTTQCEVEYVRHWFGFMQSHMEAMAPESAQKNINLKILREFPIPLPPLSLQQTFAGQIEELERIKARGRAQLAELDALFASLQERAFDGRL